jgi:hypothetical protein
MKCTDANCKAELVDQIHRSIGIAKDRLETELKEETGSLYDFIKNEITSTLDKLEQQRKDFTLACERTVKAFDEKVKGIITFPALMISLGVTVSAVAIIVTAFTVVVTRANDRNNESVDKRITSVEREDRKQTEDISDINVTLGKVAIAIEDLQKATEELKDQTEELKDTINKNPKLRSAP